MWDVSTGKPLDMPSPQLCTASCMMSNNNKIVLGRTERFGGATSIIVYDLAANQPIRHLKYDSPMGFVDGISFLKLSNDDRYVVAGFQNTFDGAANYLVFDLHQSDQAPVEPKIIAFDANVDCTAILGNHEAVTGTRKGELLIWSLRTGRPLRQLVSPGQVSK